MGVQLGVQHGCLAQLTLVCVEGDIVPAPMG